MTFRPSLFRSFFLGGFECSTHRRKDGRRLDLIAATGDSVQAARAAAYAAVDALDWPDGFCRRDIAHRAL